MCWPRKGGRFLSWFPSCSSGDGWLHKAVIAGPGQARIVEEIQLFPAGQPVLELLLDQAQARQRYWVGGGSCGVGQPMCSPTGLCPCPG